MTKLKDEKPEKSSVSSGWWSGSLLRCNSKFTFEVKIH